MNVDKDAVEAKLRADGEHDRAQQAQCVLPRTVDTERDAGLLSQLEISPRELTEEAEAQAEP